MMARVGRLLATGSIAASIALSALAIDATVGARPACAQTENRDRARELFDRAIAASAEQRFDEAALLFEQSFDLFPRANTQYNRAIALERIARPREALDALEIYFELAPPDDPGFADAVALRDRLRERLVRLALRVDPPNATVEIDGVAMPGEGASRTLMLDPGAHRIRVSAGGYASRELSVRALPGGTVEESVALAAGSAASSGDGPRSGGGSRFGLLGITGVILDGVGVATGITSLVTGLLASDIESDLVQRCGESRRECPPGSEADIEEGRSLAWASTGLTIAAGLALAAGATLLVVDLIDEGGDEARATLRVRSVAGGGALEARVRW